MAEQIPPREAQQLPPIFPRGVAHVQLDYNYLLDGPDQMQTTDRANFVMKLERARDKVAQSNRWLITVAILGHRELAHDKDTMQEILAPCIIGKHTACSHGMRPVLFIINVAAPINDWKTFRQPEVMNRLRDLEVDILLLAPGETTLAATLAMAPPRKAAILWRRELRTTAWTLQAALTSPRKMVVRELPSILVILPGRSKYCKLNHTTLI